MKSLCVRAMAAGLLVAMTGCVTKSESAALERKEQQASGPLAEAPLGSRIRKRTNIAPTGGTTREDIEQQRAQAGAQAVGAVK
ncbi:MAG TPA: hypothetical protein VGE76_18385 [Opitutaceae bacterium]